MVYPAQIQWNGFISGHVARASAARTLSPVVRRAPDGRSAVPPAPVRPVPARRI